MLPELQKVTQAQKEARRLSRGVEVHYTIRQIYDWLFVRHLLTRGNWLVLKLKIDLLTTFVFAPGLVKPISSY